MTVVSVKMFSLASELVRNRYILFLVGVFGVFCIFPEVLRGAGKTPAISKTSVRNVRYFEAPFELERKLTLNLKPLKDQAGRELRFGWVEFRKSGNKVQATIQVDYSAEFQKKWAVRIYLLNHSDRVLFLNKADFLPPAGKMNASPVREKIIQLEGFPAAKVEEVASFRIVINPAETRVYDLMDIIQNMHRYHQADSDQEARSKIQAKLCEVVKPDPGVSETTEFWKKYWLIAYQTPENHERIEKALSEFRIRYRKIVTLETRFISCSSAAEKQLLELLPEGKSAHLKPEYGSARFLSNEEVGHFLKGTQDLKSIEIIQSPRVLDIFDNPFNISFLEDTSNPGLVRINSLSGVSFDGKAILLKDEKNIRMEMKVLLTSFKKPVGNDGIFKIKIATTADIPDRQTLVFGVPFIKGRSFLYLLIKPTLVVSEEKEIP